MSEPSGPRTMPSGARSPKIGELGPRNFGAFNSLVLWTLYVKEVRRFMNVATQTVLAPMVTSLLFLAIFTLALGRGANNGGTETYALFLAPGLIMMQLLQNAFANTSSSLLISKVQGNIVDVLMPPLTATELTIGFAAGGMTRGVVVSIASGLGMWFFLPLQIQHVWAVVYFGLSASLMLALLGMLGGIWAEKFDHISAVTNFVIMPMSFLSGTFYTIDRLPGTWGTVAHFNPFFYLIDGFRYGFLGKHDGDLTLGVLVVAGVNLVLALFVHRLFRKGYNLKP